MVGAAGLEQFFPMFPPVYSVKDGEGKAVRRGTLW